MFPRIQQRCEHGCAQNQEQKRDYEQEQHRFAPSLLIANDAARGVHNKRRRLQLFFLWIILHEMLATRLWRVRRRYNDLTIPRGQDKRLLTGGAGCFDSAR